MLGGNYVAIAGPRKEREGAPAMAMGRGRNLDMSKVGPDMFKHRQAARERAAKSKGGAGYNGSLTAIVAPRNGHL